MAIFSSSSYTTHHRSRPAVCRQLGEEQGSLRGQEKTPDMPGHHYSTGNLIYLFCLTSFFRCRYAFCSHPSEQVLASRRVAVNFSPQISQTFCLSPRTILITPSPTTSEALVGPLSIPRERRAADPCLSMGRAGSLRDVRTLSPLPAAKGVLLRCTKCLGMA